MAAAPHPALDALRELELRDAALGAALDTVFRLEHGAEEVGARAAVVDAFLLAAPDEHERLAAALAAAEVAVGEAERARNAADKAARDAEARQARKRPPCASRPASPPTGCAVPVTPLPAPGSRSSATVPRSRPQRSRRLCSSGKPPGWPGSSGG